MNRPIALSAFALLLATPSFAQEADVRAVHVRYTDAEFADRAATSVLFGRLRAAARQVCDLDDPSLSGQTRRMRCEREALDRAVTQVGRSELYAFRTPTGAMTAAGAGR